MISSYLESFDMDSAPEILLENVTFWRNGADVEGMQWSLHVKRLQLCKGTIYSVLGDNMVGKSTLLRILGGAEPIEVLSSPNAATTIQAETGGQDHQGQGTLRLPTKHVCLLAHDDTMFPELSIWDNVRVARSLGRNPNYALARKTFREILSGTSIFRSRSDTEPLGQLSSGGKALIKLARACCWVADVILVDEVTAHLDQSNAQGFFDILGRFMPTGAILVLVSHAARDHELASQLAAELQIPYRPVKIERESESKCYIGL
jgi:ABC-type multidrug transport system ATPase subunit